MKDKKICFFDNQDDWLKFKEKKNIKSDILLSHLETKEAIENDQELIFTYDMSSLETGLFARGYRIFVKQKGYQMIEIKFGGKNNWTSKCIGFKSKLLNMYKKGQMNLYLRKI